MLRKYIAKDLTSHHAKKKQTHERPQIGVFALKY